MIMRFDDGRAATIDVSWSSKGGLEGRFEAYGDAGRLITDISVGSLKAFVERPAGYVVEKADAETGWVFPVPDEVRVHGHDLMMADVIERLPRRAAPPQETFRDGYVVNGVLDAAYRSHAERPLGARDPGRRPAGVAPRDVAARVRRRSRPGSRDAAAVLARVAETQADGIETASRWCAEAIAADGLVHLFGTGHSRIPVEEMFPRYGSYPGFNPIVELSMTFHTQVVGANGQRQAMFIERMPGPGRGDPRPTSASARRT